LTLSPKLLLFASHLPDGVMVAQQSLNLLV
jgi:hypothetical protein